MVVQAERRAIQGIWGLDEPCANGEAGPFCAVVSSEPGHHVGGAVIGGLDADVQQAGDPLFATIPGDATEHVRCLRAQHRSAGLREGCLACRRDVGP